ncbi:MAG: hypothetical protein P4L96_10560 [Rhodoferax sp.]|nr:hypothetical protein [Rhodoferax sp.]
MNQLEALGDTQVLLGLEGETVTPRQLLGIELNERAAAMAELVLWIGYLQWHIRTRGNKAVAEPVVHDYGNIAHRDAVLQSDESGLAYDEHGQLLTRWDGATYKTHPVTGAPVPDEAAQVPQWRYIRPRQAAWPSADFIVGNPPFIGASSMRAALGDGYVEALRSVWPEVPESADFVMYWWSRAAALAACGRARRFGLITTNSLRQTFNRRVVQAVLEGRSVLPFVRPEPVEGLGSGAERSGAGRGAGSGARPAAALILPNAQKSVPGRPHPAAGAVSLVFAIADHPWVDSANGAAVRIAMTVGARNTAKLAAKLAKAGADPRPQGDGSDPDLADLGAGRLLTVTDERTGEFGEVNVTLAESNGLIHADLSIGANVASAVALQANANVSSPGVKLHGAGFIVTPAEASLLLPPPLGEGGGGGQRAHPIIRAYRNGRDLTDTPRGVMVIDLFSLTAAQVREQFPAIYQRLLERVKPERDAKGTSKDGAGYAKLWWLHGKPRQEMRKQLAGLPRYIATVETAKHRTFQFLDASILPDNKLIAIALDDAFVLGVLSSRAHVSWSLATGSWLGVGNDPVYVKSRCFETFPFPDADTGLTPALRQRIAQLAEQIDAHRKRQQAAHAGLTLTGLYNVLEALRDGRALTAKEKTIHEQGLVGVLRELHDELDAAVLQAYGLTPGRGTDALLMQLVALNASRAAEEKNGHIRWLRPEFQNPALRQSLSNQEQSVPIPQGLQADLALDSENKGMREARASTQPWPSTLPDQVRALAQILASAAAAQTVPEIEARFKGKGPWKKGLPRILDTLEALGRARREGHGWRGQS